MMTKLLSGTMLCFLILTVALVPLLPFTSSFPDIESGNKGNNFIIHERLQPDETVPTPHQGQPKIIEKTEGKDITNIDPQQKKNKNSGANSSQSVNNNNDECAESDSEKHERPNSYYDLNCDGVVDAKDVCILQGFWNHVSPCFTNTPDIDDDGMVGQSDLGILLSRFGDVDTLIDLNNDQVIDDGDIYVIKGFWGLDPCVDKLTHVNLDLTGDNIINQSDLGVLLAHIE